MLQEGMNSLDSWGTETGRDHYCDGAEDCGGGGGGGDKLLSWVQEE